MDRTLGRIFDIKGVNEWLLANESEYRKLKEQEFPPMDNEMYWTYGEFERLIEYYSLTDRTHIAMQQFQTIENLDYNELVQWIKTQESLGAEELVSFEVQYFDWIEDVDKNLMKIMEGIYMEIAPFKETLLFCMIFNTLYWQYEILSRELTEEEINKTKEEVLTILAEN